MASSKKVWFITGVSRGLGRDLARAVLARGEVVVGTSRDGRADLAAGAGQLHLLALDVTDPDQVEEVVPEAYRLHGRIDVLVNNAGAGLLGAVEESSAAEAADVFAVNFFGPLRVIQAALPLMRAQGSGTIVNVSSIAGVAPGAGSGLYAAAKFALEGMSISLSQEVGPLGLRVIVVEPGAFRTDFLTPESIRHATGSIAAYDETSGRTVRYLDALSGKQLGDPRLGALAMIEAVESADPPRHLLLGSDALGRARTRLQQLADEYDHWQAVSLGTDFIGGDARPSLGAHSAAPRT